MKKLFVIALAAASCVLASGAANARTNVFWSIGINAAPVGVAVSNGPFYAPAPVYIEPAPVYYEPAAVYAPPVVYRPVPVVVGAGYWGPSPVVYGGGYYGGRYWDGRAHQWRQHRRDGWHGHDGGQPVPGDHRRYPHQ